MQRQLAGHLLDEVAGSCSGGTRRLPRAAWLSPSRSRSMARGVNPREMIFRKRLCCGASMLIIEKRPASIWPRPDSSSG